MDRYPPFGRKVIACTCCGRFLHTACVEEAGTAIAWHDLWFSNRSL